MSVSIITHNSEKRMLLGNDSVGSFLQVGSGWRTIRVGMRASFTDLGSSPGLGPRFWFGMMTTPNSGFTNHPIAGNCENFVGFTARNDSNWTRNAGPPVYYSGLIITPHRIVQGLPTNGSGTSTLASVDPDRRLCYIASIAKGSPNFEVFSVHPNAGSVANALLDYDPSPVQVENAFRQRSASEIIAVLGVNTGSASSYAAGTASNFAIDEGVNGELTTLCLAWNSSAFQVRVSDFWAIVS